MTRFNFVLSIASTKIDIIFDGKHQQILQIQDRVTIFAERKRTAADVNICTLSIVAAVYAHSKTTHKINN